jgi:hypothetical protein
LLNWRNWKRKVIIKKTKEKSINNKNKVKMATIKVNGVTITLTDEQLHMIDEQRRQSKWDRDNVDSSGVYAGDDVHIHKTMLLMRSWAKFHNDLDGFVADWGDKNQDKFGVFCKKTDQKYIFGIAVSSRVRAAQMFEEFIEDLEKIKW